MRIALTLRLDDAAARSVEELWQGLAAAGIARDMLDLGYAPHLSLAVAEEESARHPDLAQMLPDGEALRVRFAGLGVFPGLPACCWIAVVPCGRLLEAQREAVAALQGALHPHCHPTAWMPHVTLTAGLQDGARLAHGLAWLHERFRPATATLDRVELVRFPPVEIVASRPLR